MSTARFNAAVGARAGVAARPVTEPLQAGQRVRLTKDASRYPHCIVPAGSTGTVNEARGSDLWVLMDDDFPGLQVEGWGNCLWFGADDYFLEAEEDTDDMHPDTMLLRHCQNYLEVLAA